MNLHLISKRWLFFICLVSQLVHGLEVTVENKKNTKMPLALVTIKPVTKELKKVSRIVGQDLEAAGQFKVDLSHSSPLKNKKEITKLALQSKALAIYLLSPDADTIEWRLYNTFSGDMVAGKLVKREGRSIDFWAHVIADQIWPLLTSELGSFASVIVACKRGAQKRNHKKYSHLFAFWPVANGTTPQPVVQGERINFAPRWHPSRAQLFYSQHSPFNISLMSVLPGGKPRTIMSFDGQNMTPAVSKKGRVVISLSNRADAHLYEYQFDPKSKSGRFVLLTTGVGQYISPSFNGEDNIVFCYINKMGRPRIGMLNLKDKSISWISKGHGVSPCVSADNSKLAYSTRVDRLLQLYCYDFKTGEQRQVTFDDGHKDECSWSPCGNYLVYSSEKGVNSRIGCLHLPTKSTRFLTPVDEHWSFPAWSPVFEHNIPFMR
ncbi:hypothetical protein HOM50_02640 [bacterium]|jgi:Tol biopolymer transport system component|nr:hypothetical protein [bacterium]MBT5015278.1 hypothetical protein [bacterium]